LFEFEAAVGIVTITALHRSLKNLVMKWLIEIGPNFAVATDAKLRFADLQ
jgi:hypothetical protein